MKEAIALLLTRLAEFIGYQRIQLRELYGPLDLLMRDATTLFHLYPTVLCAPEALGEVTDRKMRQARIDAEKVMEEAQSIGPRMAELIRSKWDLVDRDDVPLFAAFLDRQLRLLHSSKMAMKLDPVIAFDANLAERVHGKAESKRDWPWGWLRRRKKPVPRVKLGFVAVHGPYKPKPVVPTA